MPDRNDVTITDVAREANVSISTVSRVLNNKSGSIRISEETTNKVWEIANRLGYQANPFASALRTKRTGLIGTIVRDIRDPFLNRLVRELQIFASQKDVELVLGHANYDIATAGRQITRMSSQYFDGLILVGDIRGDQKLIEQLLMFNMPYVAVARGFKDLNPAINVDEEVGTRLALDYLISLGHKKIAFLGGTENIGMEARLSIFKEFTKDIAQVTGEYIKLCSNNYAEAARVTDSLLQLSTPPTALFCATDRIALGAMNAAFNAGLRIPADLSVIGFDNIDDAAEVLPGLTTINQPVDEMAVQAIEILNKLIEEPGEKIENKKIAVQPTLIVRDSCDPPNI